MGISMAAAIVWSAGLASAQIAPPPPAAPEATPKYVAPAPEAARPQAPEPIRPASSKAAPNLAEDVKKATQMGVKFDSVVQRDAEGNILPLSKPVELLAVEVNHLLKDAPVTRALMEPILRARQAKWETLVIDNFDLITKLQSGVIENLDITDKAKIGEVSALIKPFQEPGSLNGELRKARIVGPIPSGLNQMIVRDWTSQNIETIRKQVRAKAGLDPAVDPAKAAADAGAKSSAGNNPATRSEMDAISQFMLRQAVAEPMYFYDKILADVATHVDATLGAAGTDAAMIQKIKAAAPADQAGLISTALQSMEAPKAREVLRQAIALRPPLPPLPDVEKIKAEYKKSLSEGKPADPALDEGAIEKPAAAAPAAPAAAPAPAPAPAAPAPAASPK
jgi:hypothetical protein